MTRIRLADGVITTPVRSAAMGPVRRADRIRSFNIANFSHQTVLRSVETRANILEDLAQTFVEAAEKDAYTYG